MSRLIVPPTLARHPGAPAGRYPPAIVPDVARRAATALGREHWVRATNSDENPHRFIVSTEHVDRYGDVIVAAGWKLTNFRRNPIALFNHDSDAPIGTWANVGVEGDALYADLKPAEPGTSPIADAVRRLLEQRILRAASVGFRPLKLEPLEGSERGGLRFLESELLEISAVSVPANPHALEIAKSFGLAPDQMARLFTASGEARRTFVGGGITPGKTAASPPRTKGSKTMPTLAERIEALEKGVLAKRDMLSELTQKEEHDEADEALLGELPDQIKSEEDRLTAWRKAQVALGAAAPPVDQTQTQHRSGGFTVPAQAKKGRPVDLLFRAALVNLRAYTEKAPLEAILRRDYGDNAELGMVLRAVTNPATTTDQAWAGVLMDTVTGDFVDVLKPYSIWANLPGMARFTFDRGKIRLPGRATSGALAGSFVAEGAPIPVRQASLTSVTLEPYKLAVITALTRELAKYSNPQAEPLIRNMMIEDTVATIDGLFLDANAAVATLRPAGLQALATGGNTRVSAGSDLADIVVDLRAATSTITGLNMGRSLVWIMNIQRVMSLNLATNAAGQFMFRDELARGTLLGVPVLASTSVPADVVFLVDTSELATAAEATPEIDVSTEATLHMEGVAATVPPTAGTVKPIAYPAGGAPAGTPGTPAFADFAQPVRSLFQTNSLAQRLIWPMDWALRRAGGVQTITGVAW